MISITPRGTAHPADLGRDTQLPLYQVYDSFVYCLPLELKKVVNTELTDISVTREAESVRTRVENSHGILKDCFQQSIVQLAQVLDPSLNGGRIFPDFVARREQSVPAGRAGRRDRGAAPVRGGAGRGLGRPDEGADLHLLRPQHQVPVYRDWSGFELFYIEILKCTKLTALLQIAHRFETFLATLLREVQKRSLLQGTSSGDEVAGVLGA